MYIELGKFWQLKQPILSDSSKLYLLFLSLTNNHRSVGGAPGEKKVFVKGNAFLNVLLLGTIFCSEITESAWLYIVYMTIPGEPVTGDTINLKK